MSSFNYWIAQGYDPATAQKLSKSKNQAALVQKDQAYREQNAAPPPPQPPPPPKPIQNTTPRKLVDDTDGENLKIKKKSKRRRMEQARGTGQLRINREGALNFGAGSPAGSGGVNI